MLYTPEWTARLIQSSAPRSKLLEQYNPVNPGVDCQSNTILYTPEQTARPIQSCTPRSRLLEQCNPIHFVTVDSVKAAELGIRMALKPRKTLLMVRKNPVHNRKDNNKTTTSLIAPCAKVLQDGTSSMNLTQDHQIKVDTNMKQEEYYNILFVS